MFRWFQSDLWSGRHTRVSTATTVIPGEFRYCRTAQATKASIAIPAMRNKLMPSARSSLNRRANSSLPHRLMLGANLDMAPPASKRCARPLTASSGLNEKTSGPLRRGHRQQDPTQRRVLGSLLLTYQPSYEADERYNQCQPNSPY